MFVSRSSCIRSIAWLFFSLVILGSPLDAKTAGSLRGTVVDPLGAAISNAKVVLIQQGDEVKVTSTDQDGVFVFSPVMRADIASVLKLLVSRTKTVPRCSCPQERL